MCHGGVFERALVPERSHTHMCASRGLRASAPSRVCLSNSHKAMFCIHHAWFCVYRTWGATFRMSQAEGM